MLTKPALARNIKDLHPTIQILFFVILVYLLPLGCILLMNTALGQMDIINFILFGIEAASPTVAAVITVAFFEKKSGIKAFFHFSFSPKLKISSIFACVIIAFTIILAAKTISCLLLKVPFETANLTSKQLIIIAWAFVAEEIGWRGFLTKRLTAFVGQSLVPLFVGLIWAFWHYHFFITGTIDVAIPLFTAGCIADSYLYSALLKISRGNILTAMIFHMTSNLLINLFLINPNVNGKSSLPYAMYVIFSAVSAIVITATLNHSNRRKSHSA